MKFYRTYLITFRTSTGLKYYAGKRESTYENPHDDPYTGSGKIIMATVKKYGLSCISSIEWFEHTKETVKAAEIRLIAETKKKYGSACTNIAQGGDGNPMEYFTDEQKANHRDNVISFWQYCSPEYMDEHIKKSISYRQYLSDEELEYYSELCSINSKKMWENFSDEELESIKSKLSSSQNEYWENISDDEREHRSKKCSDGQKHRWATATEEQKQRWSKERSDRLRKSDVWYEPLNGDLWLLWNGLGKPKGGKFHRFCVEHNITELTLQALVKDFVKRSESEVIDEYSQAVIDLIALKTRDWDLPEYKKPKEQKQHGSRTSAVWSDPLYSILWDEWNRLGNPKYATFQKHCTANNITNLSLLGITKHFMKRLAGQQDRWMTAA